MLDSDSDPGANRLLEQAWDTLALSKADSGTRIEDIKKIKQELKS